MKMSTELLQIMSEMETKFNAKLEERDTKIAKLEEENATHKKYILHTRIEHEKLQQYINRDTFKICGIEEPTLPPNVHEDTDETVTSALQLAKITLPQESIDISHRLPVRDPANTEVKACESVIFFVPVVRELLDLYTIKAMM